MDKGIALTVLDTQEGVTVRADGTGDLTYRRMQMAHHCVDRPPLKAGALLTLRKVTEDGNMLVRSACGCDHLLYDAVRRPGLGPDGDGVPHSRVAAAHRCPACGSGSVSQSRRRGWLERFILPVAGYRPYQCLQCGERFLDRRSSQPAATSAGAWRDH